MSKAADVVELDEERVKRDPSNNHVFETAGEMLKAAREARGMSIEDVAAATNVREAHIQSIEEMAIDRLPVAAYTTGFVKAYGQVMELPVDALVSRFRKEAGYATSQIAPEVHIRDRRELSGGRELSLLAVVAILAFIIWVAWQVFREPEINGPVQISGTPLQERPINERNASYGGSNEVPMAAATPVEEPTPNLELVSDSEESVDGSPSEEGNAEEGEQSARLAGPTDIELSVEDALANAVNEEIALEGFADPQAISTNAETAQATDIAETSTEETDQILEPVSQADQLNAVQAETLTAQAEDIDQGPQLIVGEAAPNAVAAETGEQAIEAVRYTDPVVTARVSPIYPRRCERLSTGNEQVVVTYDVSSRGQPVNVRVTQTTNDCFNAAAVSAVGRWRFEPATRNGSPIPAYTRSTRFRFDLPQ